MYDIFAGVYLCDSGNYLSFKLRQRNFLVKNSLERRLENLQCCNFGTNPGGVETKQGLSQG